MKGDWNAKKFLALFMAVAMVLASGIFVTTQSFKATDDEYFEADESEDVESVDADEEEYEEEEVDLDEEDSEDEEDFDEEEADDEETADAEDEESDEETENAEDAEELQTADVKSVKVTFDLNGGEGNETPDSVDAEADESGDLNIDLPDLEDYTDGNGATHIFEGWSTDAGATEAEDNITADGESVELYAVWSLEEPDASEEQAAEEAAEEQKAAEEAAEAEQKAAEETAEEENAEAAEETAEEQADDVEAEEAVEEETEEAAEENPENAEDEQAAEELADGQVVAGETDLTEEQKLEQLLATYTAGSFSETTAGGITVNVGYDEKVFPPGTTMVVTEISDEEALEAVSGAVENAVEAKGVDITFYNADGEEIQPYDGAEVSVSLTLSQPMATEEQTLVHVDGSGDATEVSGDVSATGADFEADSFSKYLLVGQGESGTYENHTYEYNIQPSEALTLTSNVQNASGKFLGGEWAVASGEDIVSFTSKSNTKPETGAEAPSVDIKTSGKAGDASVTFTYEANKTTYVDTYAIHIKGYVFHFNANGASGQVEDISATIGVSGTANVTLPDAGELSRPGYNFKGWSMKQDHMTHAQRYGWFAYTNNATAETKIYPAGATYNISNTSTSEEYTFYAMWAPTEGVSGAIGFYVRNDGSIQTEPGSYSSNYYTTVTPNGQYTMNVSNLADYITEVYTEIDVDRIQEKVTDRANSEVETYIRKFYNNIQENGSDADKQKYAKLDMDKYYITWYVIKDQGEWHVDGVLRARSDAGTNDNDTMVSLDFRPNCNDYSGKAPVGMEYKLKVAKAGVALPSPAQNSLSRTGYTFNGWDTRADGSGDRYSAGDIIKFDKNTVLYAQWRPNDGVPYTLIRYDTETEQEIKNTREVRTGVTGNTIEAIDSDKTLEGYVFDESNSKNVLEASIKGDGTTELHLWFKPAHAVVITAPSTNKTYDGEAVSSSVASFTVDDSETTEYTVNNDSITFTYNGKEYTIKDISPSIKDAEGKSVDSAKDAGNYTVSFGEGTPAVDDTKTSFTVTVNPGYINISKRPITITSDSGEWQYDGKAHTAEKVTVTLNSGKGEALVGDDKLPDVKYTGSQKAIGSSQNTFECNTDSLKTNYDVTTVYGTLTVTGAGADDARYEINVRPKSETIVYDGKKHSVNKDDFEIVGSDSASASSSPLARLGDFFSGTSTTDFTIGDESFTITGLAASGEDGTDVGTYNRVVTETERLTIKDSSGNDVTGEFIVNKLTGALVIEKRNVALKSASLTKPYDGTALENPDDQLITSEKDTIKITENGSISEGENEGFVSGEGVDKYSFTGKQKRVGQSSNEFSYTLKSNTNENNYNITASYGDLVVTNPDAKIDVTVTPNGEPDRSDDGSDDGKDDGSDDGSDDGQGGNSDDGNNDGSGAESDGTPNGGKFKYNGELREVRGFVNEHDGRIEVTGSNGKTYYVEGLSAGVSGTDADTYEVQVTGDAKVYDEDNEDVTEQVNINISKAYLIITARSVTLTSASLTKPYDGKPLTNPDDQLITEAESPVSITTQGSIRGDGFVGNDSATYSFSGSQTIKGESQNIFSYTLNGTDTNYKITTAFGTLAVGTRGAGDGDKLGATITANSGTIDAYDGQEHSVTGFVGQESDGSVKVTIDGVEYTITGVTAEAKGTDAGDYTTEISGDVVVTDSQGNDVTDEFKVTKVPGTLTIKKATVNIKSASLTKAYDGKVLKNGDTLAVNAEGITVTEKGTESGWANGEGAEYSFTGKQKAVGSSGNTIAIASYKDGTKPENYNINISSGTLTVTNRDSGLPEITITPVSGEFPYDGTNHTVSGFEGQDDQGRIPVEIDGETYYVTGVTSEATAKDVNGDGVNTTINGTPVITDDEGNDVTDQFNVVPATGTLKITKRPLTITSATLTKVYNGKALKNGDDLTVAESEGVTITTNGSEDGWVEGEGASYEFTGKQKVVGSSFNTFNITANEGTDLNNYELTKNEGTLTVTSTTGEGGNGAFTVNLTVNSGTFTYDGEEHTVSGFEGQDGDGSIQVEINGDTYTVTGLTAEKTATHVNESGAVEAQGTATVTDDENNDVTDQFTVNTTPGTLTVEKRDITVKSSDGTWEYDGKAHTGDELAPKLVVTPEDGWIGDDEPKWKFSGSQKAPGTSINTFEEIGNKLENYAADNSDYNVKLEYGTLTVTGAEAKYEINVRADDILATYDGKKHSAANDGFKLEGATSSSGSTSLLSKLGDFVSGTSTTDFAIGGEKFTITGLGAEGEGTDAGTYAINVTGTETIKDSDGNDVTGQFTVNKIPGTLTIGKAKVTLVSKTLTKDYDGDPLENGDTPVQESGWIGSDGANYEFTGSQTAPGTSPNAFTYTLSDGTTEAQYNESGHKNYIITKTEGNLTVNSSDASYEVTVTPIGGSYKYDGQEHSVSGFVEDEDGDGRIEVTGSNEKTYYVTGLSAGASLKDVGTTSVAVSGDIKIEDAKGNDVTSEFRVNYGEANLTITKRSVILNSASLTKPYDGDALVNPEGQLTGLTDADPVKVDTDGSIGGDGFVDGQGAEYSFTGTQTLVGFSANSFDYTLTEGTDPDNYEITKNPGTLTVENRSGENRLTAAVIGSSDTVTAYDGKEHTVSGFEGQNEDGSIPIVVGGKTYYITGITSEASGTDAGEYPTTISGTLIVEDADGNDVTDQFDVTVTPGRLTINKADVTLESASINKSYDGTALTNGDTPLATEKGFAEGEGAEYTFTGTRTLVGSTPNTFTYALKSGTKESNYNITPSYGTLTVTARTGDDRIAITVTANSGEYEYNGKERSVNGFIGETDGKIPVTYGGVTYYVSGLTSQAEAKDVNGDGIKTNIEGTPVVTDAEGNDVTAQFNVIPTPGTLKITPKALTLTSADLEKNYDGTALTNGDTPLAVEEGWAKGDGATYNFTGSQRTVGIGINKFDVVPNEGTSLDNYAVTKTEGKLEVKNADANFEVTVKANSGEFTYDGTVHTVSGFENEDENGRIPVQPEGNPNTFYVSGLTSTKTATNVSDSGEIPVVGSWVVTDEDGTDVSDQFNVEVEKGTLTINQCPITLVSESLSKPYDGTELTNAYIMPGTEGPNRVTVYGEMPADEYININEKDFKGKRTLVGGVGEKENTFEWTVSSNPYCDWVRYASGNGKSGSAQTEDTGFFRFGMVVHAAEASKSVNGGTASAAAEPSEDNYDITVEPGDLVVTATGNGDNGGDGGNTDIDVSKFASKTHEEGVYEVGQTIDYTVTVTNIYDDARTITIEEQLAGATLDQNVFENVAGGDTISTMAHYTVTEADALSGEALINSVKVSYSDSSDGGDGTQPGREIEVPDKEETAIQKEVPSLSMTKKRVLTGDELNGPVKVGDTITYEITVLNNGKVTVNNVQVTDELTGFSETVDVLTPGGSKTFTTTYTVKETDVAAGKIINTALVSGGTTGGGSGNGDNGGDNGGNDDSGNGGDNGGNDGSDNGGDNGGNGGSGNGGDNGGNDDSGNGGDNGGNGDSNNGGNGGGNVTVTAEAEETVEVSQTFNLTIHYTDAEGNPIASDYTGSYKYGESFYVESPGVSGYTATYPYVASDGSGMPSKDVEVTVTYVKNAEVISSNESINGGSGSLRNSSGDSDDDDDDDDDDGSSSSTGSKGSSGTTANRSGSNGSGNSGAQSADSTGASTPEVTDDQVAESNNRVRRNGGTPIGDVGAHVTIGEDGEPTLVSASDAETPLFNLGLGDHKCNVLRLLILLAAFAVVLVHTKKMRQYQSRLFELREKLEEEKK